MTADLEPRFVPVADRGLLVEFATEVSEAANRAVVELDRALGGMSGSGIEEVVPALVNLLIVFDPVATDHSLVEAQVRSVLPTPAVDVATTERHVVQVCYEHTFAPDLADVAEACGLSIEAAVSAHLRGDYRVLMYGFAPGYAYLGGVPDELQIPRKPAAVRDIAASSVLIAGAQCIVTPTVMPTGWSVIGRSTTEVLSNNPESPFLFGLGDELTFERIDVATFEQASRTSRATNAAAER